jgi:hypothetical protein
VRENKGVGNLLSPGSQRIENETKPCQALIKSIPFFFPAWHGFHFLSPSEPGKKDVPFSNPISSIFQKEAEKCIEEIVMGWKMGEIEWRAMEKTPSGFSSHRTPSISGNIYWAHLFSVAFLRFFQKKTRKIGLRKRRRKKEPNKYFPPTFIFFLLI